MEQEEDSSFPELSNNMHVSKFISNLLLRSVQLFVQFQYHIQQRCVKLTMYLNIKKKNKSLRHSSIYKLSDLKTIGQEG